MSTRLHIVPIYERKQSAVHDLSDKKKVNIFLPPTDSKKFSAVNQKIIQRRRTQTGRLDGSLAAITRSCYYHLVYRSFLVQSYSTSSIADRQSKRREVEEKKKGKNNEEYVERTIKLEAALFAFPVPYRYDIR